jgi:hypothetical protein
MRLIIRTKTKVIAAPVIGSSWKATPLAGINGE